MLKQRSDFLFEISGNIPVFEITEGEITRVDCISVTCNKYAISFRTVEISNFICYMFSFIGFRVLYTSIKKRVPIRTINCRLADEQRRTVQDGSVYPEVANNRHIPNQCAVLFAGEVGNFIRQLFVHRSPLFLSKTG